MNIFSDLPRGLLDEVAVQRRIETISPDEKLSDALEYCISVAGRWCKSGKVFVRPIEPDYLDAERLMPAIYVTIGLGGFPKIVGFDIEQSDVDEVWRLFLTRPVFASEIKERLTTATSMGFQMSQAARETIGAILTGHLVAPASKGHRPSEFHRDTLFCGLAKRLTSIGGYDLGASVGKMVVGTPIPVRAATIVAAAVSGYGIKVRPQQADKIARKTNLPIELAGEFGVFAVGRRENRNALAAWNGLGMVAENYDAEMASARGFVAHIS
jgi:hypothetical protein